MAGYGYIRIAVGPPGAKRKDRATAFSPVVHAAVARTLGPRWKIEMVEEEATPTWWVHLPGNAVPDNGMACTEDGRPFDEDIGFTVALEARVIAFRHPPSDFAHWAQACVEEEISQFYGRGIYYDATGRTTKPGPKEHRGFKTFYDYLVRNLKMPLSDEDRQALERFKRHVPEGHWGEPSNV